MIPVRDTDLREDTLEFRVVKSCLHVYRLDETHWERGILLSLDCV